MAPRKPSTATIRTRAELARMLKVDRSTVTRRLRRRDCPVSESGPWDADDVATLADWLNSGDTSGDADDLRHAQAVKAKVLAQKYLLEMAVMLGRVGNAQAEVLLKSAPSAATVHFQAQRYRLADLLVEHGKLSGPDADAVAEGFMQDFYADWAATLMRVVNFHYTHNDEFAPIVRRLRALCDELGDMVSTDSTAAAEILRQLDDVERRSGRSAGIAD